MWVCTQAHLVPTVHERFRRKFPELVAEGVLHLLRSPLEKPSGAADEERVPGEHRFIVSLRCVVADVAHRVPFVSYCYVRRKFNGRPLLQ